MTDTSPSQYTMNESHYSATITITEANIAHKKLGAHA